MYCILIINHRFFVVQVLTRLPNYLFIYISYPQKTKILIDSQNWNQEEAVSTLVHLSLTCKGSRQWPYKQSLLASSNESTLFYFQHSHQPLRILFSCRPIKYLEHTRRNRCCVYSTPKTTKRIFRACIRSMSYLLDNMICIKNVVLTAFW